MKSSLEEFYKNKKVFITGDSGFKGSWLSLWLLNLNCDITGYGITKKEINSNYSLCKLENKYNHIEADIRDYDKLYEAINNFKPDIVFHLASQALVIDSYNQPVDNFSTNVMGTVNLFDICRKFDYIKSIVNITSDKCYENKEWIYSYREIDSLGGKDPYSASKACSEIVTHSYLQSFYMDDNTANIGTARAGNVIGGGDWAANRIVPDCIRALENNEDIVIRNPNSVRPWQYVLEPLSGYLKLAMSLYEDKKFSGSWNFGPINKDQIDVLTVVKEIINCWGSGSYKINQNSSAFKESSLLQLDINKSITYLKWKPILDLKQSIEFTVDDYKCKNDVFDNRVKRILEFSKLMGT